MHSFILRDGRRFVALPQIDTKQLLLSPPKLFGLQSHEKRKWYDTFCQHCLQNGVYDHSWLQFEQNHGGFTDFECSDTPSSDLPERLETYIQNLPSRIVSALGTKGIFFTDSPYESLLATHFGKGHFFVRAFVEPDHPAFRLSPRLMIKSLPVSEVKKTQSRQLSMKMF
jgi:hypothetical protein